MERRRRPRGLRRLCGRRGQLRAGAPTGLGGEALLRGAVELRETGTQRLELAFSTIGVFKVRAADPERDGPVAGARRQGGRVRGGDVVDAIELERLVEQAGAEARAVLQGEVVCAARGVEAISVTGPVADQAVGDGNGCSRRRQRAQNDRHDARRAPGEDRGEGAIRGAPHLGGSIQRGLRQSICFAEGWKRRTMSGSGCTAVPALSLPVLRRRPSTYRMLSRRTRPGSPRERFRRAARPFGRVPALPHHRDAARPEPGPAPRGPEPRGRADPSALPSFAGACVPRSVPWRASCAAATRHSPLPPTPSGDIDSHRKRRFQSLKERLQ